MLKNSAKKILEKKGENFKKRIWFKQEYSKNSCVP